MTRLADIEGIGDVQAAKLEEAGIASIEELLREGGAPAGRDVIARKSGIDRSKILEWVNHADLMRINGVGSEYSDLLEAAGVDTVRELAQRNPESLQTMLAQTNAAKNLVRRVPTVDDVQKWVAEAKSLPPAVTY